MKIILLMIVSIVAAAAQDEGLQYFEQQEYNRRMTEMRDVKYTIDLLDADIKYLGDLPQERARLEGKKEERKMWSGRVKMLNDFKIASEIAQLLQKDVSFWETQPGENQRLKEKKEELKATQERLACVKKALD